MIKKIIKYPNPSLRETTRLVNVPLSQELIDHIQDLKDTLAEEKDGLAIASNQILEHGHRVFVVNPNVEYMQVAFPNFVVINPLWKPFGSDMSNSMEGCLSFPGYQFVIPRWELISLKWCDIKGNWYEKKFSGPVARAVQHETDHLEGKLFIDQLPKNKQVQIRNDVIKFKKAGKW